jgi:hypothetical protein
MQSSEIQRALAAAMSIASALGLPVDDVIRQGMAKEAQGHRAQTTAARRQTRT